MSMPENLGQKGLTKIVKICVKIRRIFVSKGSKDGIMMSNGDQMVTKRKQNVIVKCTPALAGLDAGFSRTMSLRGAGGA
jgi:hypothetical protein